MSNPKTDEELRVFYERWNSSVFTYCRLFLGDHDRAESATEQAFIEYIRRGFAVKTDRIPFLLLRCAVDATRSICLRVQPRGPGGEELEDVLRLVACEARSVFILRSVLDLDAACVAVATGLTTEQVHKLGMQALLQIRQCWLKKG